MVFIFQCNVVYLVKFCIFVIEFKNKKMSTIKAIGFANKYYTLWSITEQNQYVTDINGNSWLSGVYTVFQYHKNISIDLEKTKILHPDLEIWEDLRGKTSSWLKKSEKNLCPNIIDFGKYYKYTVESILEIDFNYLIWLCDNRSNTENANYAMTLPKVIDYFENKRIDSLKEKNNLILEFNALIEKGEIELIRESNLKIHGDLGYFTEKIGNIIVTFNFIDNMFIKREYQGFEYGFPSIDDKYKTMKFKNLKYIIEKSIDEDSNEDHFNVNVIDVKEIK